MAAIKIIAQSMREKWPIEQTRQALAALAPLPQRGESNVAQAPKTKAHREQPPAVFALDYDETNPNSEGDYMLLTEAAHMFLSAYDYGRREWALGGQVYTDDAIATAITRMRLSDVQLMALRRVLRQADKVAEGEQRFRGRMSEAAQAERERMEKWEAQDAAIVGNDEAPTPVQSSQARPAQPVAPSQPAQTRKAPATVDDLLVGTAAE